MKIIQIGPYPISHNCLHGGVEVSVFGLVEELVRQGHCVHVFDFPRLGGKDGIECDGQRTIHRFYNPGKHNQDAVLRVNEIADYVVAQKPDAIHIHGTGLISAELYYALRDRGYQPLVTIHGLLRVEKRNALTKSRKHFPKALYQYIKQSKVECQLLEQVPKAIVDTEYLVEALKQYPVKKLPELHVIPQGANAAYYDLQCNSAGNTILCVGAFGPRKSQINLVKAFNSLRERDVEAKLNLCGIMADEAYFAQLKQMAAESAYSSDIAIQINLPQEKLYQQYEQAHIFALPSQEESQGIVLAEAMACGLPVVATKVGGIPYVVNDGKCGLLSDYGDIKVMADNLAMLLSNTEMWNTFSKAAKEKAQEYKWTHIANKILELYEL